MDEWVRPTRVGLGSSLLLPRPVVRGRGPEPVPFRSVPGGCGCDGGGPRSGRGEDGCHAAVLQGCSDSVSECPGAARRVQVVALAEQPSRGDPDSATASAPCIIAVAGSPQMSAAC